MFQIISHFSNTLHRILLLLAPEPGFNPGSHTTGHVFLVSFNMKRSLSLPVTRDAEVFRIKGQLFYETFLNLSLLAPTS